MKRVKSLNELDYTSGETVSFLATVLRIDTEGDGDKKPYKVTLKLEESGEVCQVYSWNWKELDTYKTLVNTADVYSFDVMPNIYKNENQIRVGSIFSTGQTSNQKIVRNTNIDNIKSELISLINVHLPQNGQYQILRTIIDDLVINNENFWKWPAASSIHHNYPGGLAKHTLNVVKNAISIWKIYEGSNANLAIIVAGAVLHDIGKLDEYKENGDRTYYGNLVSHLVSGYGKIIKMAVQMGIDPEKDLPILMVSHIILSHHDKLEFGSPVRPGILEAVIVSKADALDASFEGADKSLNETNLFEQTLPIGSLDRAKLLKWHN